MAFFAKNLFKKLIIYPVCSNYQFSGSPVKYQLCSGNPVGYFWVMNLIFKNKFLNTYIKKTILKKQLTEKSFESLKQEGHKKIIMYHKNIKSRRKFLSFKQAFLCLIILASCLLCSSGCPIKRRHIVYKAFCRYCQRTNSHAACLHQPKCYA